MNPSNAQKTLLNSDYPMDQVIFQTTRSVNTSPNLNTASITHNLPFTPLISGVWSLTPDFQETYDLSGGPLGSSFQLYNVYVYTNSNTIDLTIYNNTGSNSTLYFYFYGFMPSNVSTEVGFTASLGSNFIINSEYNYMKLYMTDRVSMPSGSGITTINHGLGYMPFVSSWHDRVGIIQENDQTSLDTTIGQFNTVTVYVDNDNLYLRRYSVTSSPWFVHYRMYVDG